MSYLNVIADAIGVKPDHPIVLDIERGLLLAGYVVKQPDKRLPTSVHVCDSDRPYEKVVAVRMQLTDGILGAEHTIREDMLPRHDFLMGVLPNVLASSLTSAIQNSAIEDISLAIKRSSLALLNDGRIA